jgi:hypothetical protein
MRENPLHRYIPTVRYLRDDMYVDLSFHLIVWMKIAISVFQWNLKWKTNGGKYRRCRRLAEGERIKRLFVKTSFSPSLIETHNKKRLYGCLYTRSLHMVIWSQLLSLFHLYGRRPSVLYLQGFSVIIFFSFPTQTNLKLFTRNSIPLPWKWWLIALREQPSAI